MRDDSVELNRQAPDHPEELDSASATEQDALAEAEAAEAAAEDAAPAMIREKPDGEVDPLGETGWYLEREREDRGLTLEEAGEATGIHPYHLDAIEWGDLTRMPERFEALEMVGAYAHYLGFDPEPLVEHYALLLPAPAPVEEPRHPANPAPLSSAKVLLFGKLAQLRQYKLKRVPGGVGGLVAGVAAAALLFAGASYMLLPGEGEDGMEQAAAQSDLKENPMPSASTGPDTADVSVGEEPMPDDETLATRAVQAGEDDLAGTGLDGISSLIEENVPGAGNAPQAQMPASANDVAMTGEGREFGTGNGESRLTLKAKAPVWVRIEDAQGNVVMTQMLMKGDTYRVPNREGLVVIARDGGLLSYMIDGKEKGILGTPGEILVGRSLDLKSFEG